MHVELSQLFDNRILFCWRISRFDDYLRANRADFSMSNPLMQNDTPVKLLGVPVITCRPMPKVESGSMPVLYGDFSRFLIGDRDHRSVKRLNELYARRGLVGFTVSERVDAVLLDKRAIAGLKVQ